MCHCRRMQWHPTPVLLPGKSRGRRILAGCCLWGCTELDTTERLHFHFSLSCIGEGNGNPRQCSCLENPRDGGALWTAVYGVAQSRTRLKWRSSSSRKQCLLETLWGRHQGMEGKWTRTPCSLWWTCRYLQTVYMSCFGVYISGHLFIHLLYFACQKKICFAYTFNEEKTR